MTIVVVTGGFDPLHSGHIAYLNAARRMGDKLAVGLNSDEWLVRKKGYAFMPMVERQQIVGNLKSVDHTFTFDDADGTACAAIEDMLSFFPFHDILFANGGDRTEENIPEMKLAAMHPVRVKFAFGVGGDTKINSSRDILGNYKNFILGKTYNDKAQLVQSTTNSAHSGPQDIHTPIDGARSIPRFNTQIVDEGDVGWKEEIHSSRWNRSSFHDDPSWSGNGGQE